MSSVPVVQILGLVKVCPEIFQDKILPMSKPTSHFIDKGGCVDTKILLEVQKILTFVLMLKPWLNDHKNLNL